MFKDARLWGDIRENPVEGVKPPPGASGREAYVLDPAQAMKFIEACSEDLADLKFVLLLMTGLRPREMTGLTWPHLKLVAQEIEIAGRLTTIERGVVEVRQMVFKKPSGEWVFTKPKTKKSIRDIPFPAPLYHGLMLYRRQVERQKALMGSAWHDYGLVFPAANGLPQCHHSIRCGRFHTLLRRAGLPLHFTLYSLRYSFATLQMLAGERDKVIAELMGHTRVDFNQQVYQKVLPQMRDHASDGLEKLLFSSSRTVFAQSDSELAM